MKQVVGHSFPVDMNPGHNAIPGTDRQGNPTTFYEKIGPVKFMLITFEDHSREMVNLDRYESYFTSRELFLMQAKQVKQDSNGQADVI